jgi:acetyl esterase/lipase
MTLDLSRRRLLGRALGTLVAAPLLAATAGCSSAGLVQALTPTGHYTRQDGIAYGGNPRQVLDVYVPKDARPGLPVVVFFYGGSWQHGERALYSFVGEALTSRQYIAVIADYRLWPEVGFPLFIDDGASVVAWTHANIAAHGGDPGRIVLAGHSAGAHIAAMLTLDRAYLAKAGTPDVVTGFVGLAGPYDFLPLTDPELQALFGPPAGLAATQPINFVRADAPPLWLAHGTADTTVAPKNSINLAARTHAVGGRATLKLYDGYSHVGLVARLAAVMRPTSTLLDDMAAFIDALPAQKPAAL